MVQDHHDFRGDERTHYHSGHSIDFDVIVGEEELLKRDDDAETEHEVQRDETQFLNFALDHRQPTHRPPPLKNYQLMRRLALPDHAGDDAHASTALFLELLPLMLDDAPCARSSPAVPFCLARCSRAHRQAV